MLSSVSSRKSRHWSGRSASSTHRSSYKVKRRRINCSKKPRKLPSSRYSIRIWLKLHHKQCLLHHKIQSKKCHCVPQQSKALSASLTFPTSTSTAKANPFLPPKASFRPKNMEISPLIETRLTNLEKRIRKGHLSMQWICKAIAAARRSTTLRTPATKKE